MIKRWHLDRIGDDEMKLSECIKGGSMDSQKNIKSKVEREA